MSNAQIIDSIKGSFAVEGIELSKKSLHNLKRLSQEEISCDALVAEIIENYSQKRN